MRLHARQDGSTQTFRTSRSHPSSALSCVMPLRAPCRFQTDELEHSDILGPLESQARDLRKLRSAPEPALVLHPAAGLRPRKSPAQRLNGTTVARLLLRPKAVVVPGDVMRARLPRPA